MCSLRYEKEYEFSLKYKTRLNPNIGLFNLIRRKKLKEDQHYNYENKVTSTWSDVESLAPRRGICQICCLLFLLSLSTFLTFQSHVNNSFLKEIYDAGHDVLFYL